ncbi:hypothetical protein [Burkholderia pseudomallei]|uniref:hypothetical protein n=1 Tax=Burkholderia pseudomallei TaxID=28450 RepID=UPI0012FB2232|nr:hypothetical protein [Burkholderia pseudomallei]
MSNPSRIFNRQTLPFNAAARTPTPSQNIPGLHRPLVTFTATKPMTTMRSQIPLIQAFTAIGHCFSLENRQSVRMSKDVADMRVCALPTPTPPQYSATRRLPFMTFGALEGVLRQYTVIAIGQTSAAVRLRNGMQPCQSIG